MTGKQISSRSNGCLNYYQIAMEDKLLTKQIDNKRGRETEGILKLLGS